MEKLATAIKRAAQLRDGSWSREAGYTLTLKESCTKAALEAGFDTRGTRPVYLLLVNSWNAALKWAETI